MRLLRIHLLFLIALSAAGEAHAQPVTQPFTFSLVSHSLPQVNHGDTALGDFDGDGDLDVFLIGIEDGQAITALYRNEGDAVSDESTTFQFEDAGVSFHALFFGSGAWGDYDADGDLDLAVFGSRTANRPYDPVTLLFENDRGELRQSDLELRGYHSGDVAWSDYDNDGDLDLLVGGVRLDGGSGATLYRNDADGFAESDAELPGLAHGSVEFGDADGDGDQDIAIGGLAADGIYADVYENGDGTFVPTAAGLMDGAFGDFAWGDYDGDGDLDLIQSGGQFSAQLLDGFTQVYLNSEAGFVPLSLELPTALSGSTTWGDYDNDGDLDLLVMGGRDVYGPRTAELFENEAGQLTRKSYLIGVIFGAASWGDLEGDGDLDLVTTGLPSSSTPLVNLYENRRQVVNLPAPPTGLSATVASSGVELSWDASPATASFNVRVGTQPGTADIMAPMADLTSGRRLVSDRGNADHRTFSVLRGLTPGRYYWSVQSLDHAMAGSTFADEQTFVVSQATSSQEPAQENPQTKLRPTSPNPSRERITFRYDLGHSVPVTIQVHDMLGRVVATLIQDEQAAGTYSVEWNPRSSNGAAVGSGVYVCSFRAGAYRQSATFVLSR